MVLVLTLFILVTRLFCTDAIRFILEAEDSRGKHTVVPRANASGGKSIILRKGETLALSFCLRIGTNVTIEEIIYSNDENDDTVFVALNEQPISQFDTNGQSNSGHLWNYFSASILRERLFLEDGWHVLKLKTIRGDMIEIDSVKLEIEDEHIDENIFKCTSVCVGVPSIALASDYTGAGGLAIQRSYASQCAEEDNVNIPLFKPDVKRFRITASMPKHGSFRNSREEDPSNCPHLQPTIFKFNNFTTNRLADPLVDGQASLIFDSNDKTESSTRMVLMFRLRKNVYGLENSEIGSMLTLKMKSLDGLVKVGMEYYTKDNVYTKPEMRNFTEDAMEHSWEFGDFTWEETEMNFILLTVETDSKTPAVVEVLRLTKRALLPDKITTLYASDELIIEGGISEFWWLAPESMTASLISGEHWENIHFIRIYRPIPWTKGFAQVFVLYQDGNIRLLPVPPDGVDWMPFGTSVIIGESDHLEKRPHASVDQIRIAPDIMAMNIKYKDGGSAVLELGSVLTKTTITVSEITRKLDSSPFATFRSMYIRMSKSCSDTIVSDEGHSSPVLDKWDIFYGRTFLLMNTCSSTYLTMSPDIKIEILESSEATVFNKTQEVEEFFPNDEKSKEAK